MCDTSINVILELVIITIIVLVLIFMSTATTPTSAMSLYVFGAMRSLGKDTVQVELIANS